MNNGVKEFYIADVVTGESGRTTVIGRAGDQPIPVGTRFTLIYKQKKQKYPEGFTEEPVREKEKQISVTVLDASAYGRQMKEVPGNTTGSLVVDENDMEALPPGWMLSEK